MAIITVKQYGYEKAASPDSLDSGRLANCIAVGALDGENAYMVHEPSYAWDKSSALDNMLNELKRTEKPKIYIAGGSIPKFVMLKDMVTESRKKVLERIAQAGFSVEETRWGKDGFVSFLSLAPGQQAVFREEENTREKYYC